MKYLPDWLTCGGYFVNGYIYCLDFTCLSYIFTFFALYNCYYLVTLPLSLCYLVTLFPFYPVTLLLCYLVTLFPNFYSVTLLLCSLVTPLPSYLVEFLSCDSVTSFNLSPYLLPLSTPATHTTSRAVWRTF